MEEATPFPKPDQKVGQTQRSLCLMLSFPLSRRPWDEEEDGTHGMTFKTSSPQGSLKVRWQKKTTLPLWFVRYLPFSQSLVKTIVHLSVLFCFNDSVWLA